MTEQVRRPAGEARLTALVAGLICYALIAFAPAIFNDGDTSWHLAAGRLMLAERTIPTADPFSYTFLGHPWVAHEWLAEVLMAGAERLFGWSGIALLTAFAFGALVYLLTSELARRLGPRRGVIALVLVLIGLVPFILARPHLVAWPLLAGWTIVLIRSREQDRAPPLAAAAIMLVWANLHGSFLFGFLLLGAFGLEALIAAADRRRALLGWAVFGLAALLLALANPQGYRLFLYPIEVGSMKALPLILEWRRTDPSQDTGFLLALAAGAAIALLRRGKVPPLRLLLLAVMLYLAIAHLRHQAVLLIVGSLLLAGPVGATFAAPAPTAPSRREPRLVAILALVALAVGGLRLAMPMRPRDSSSNPITAIAHVPPSLRGRPVFNSYGFGGPLILAGLRPYIDGRGDMYGDAGMFAYDRIARGDPAALDGAVRRWGLAWAILEPDTPLVKLLDRRGWRRVYADRYAVIQQAQPQ